MKRAAVLLLALTLALGLAGCLPDQSKDVFACESQASRFFQTYHAVDLNAPSSQYIMECMAAKGWDFTIQPADCDSHRPLPTQGACYAPQNWLAALYDRWRRPLKGN
jgi:hypothetical protein